MADTGRGGTSPLYRVSAYLYLQTFKLANDVIYQSNQCQMLTDEQLPVTES